jgi:DNA polymerase-1
VRAVIDGDVLCFQSSVLGEGAENLQWTDTVETSKGWTGLTLQVIDAKIKEWCRAAGCSPDDPIMAFSDLGGLNFRKEFCPHYKANRVTDKPSDYETAREYIMERYQHYQFPRMEGDDVLGLLLTGPNGNRYVGISTDKDIYTIPGNVVRIGDQKDGYFKNTERAADLYWMGQTITGDTVDNYKGCPGAGKKRADDALQGCLSLERMWDNVLMVYADMFDHPRWGAKFTQRTAYDEALMNARCARILRYGDWDKQTGEIKLWEPK